MFVSHGMLCVQYIVAVVVALYNNKHIKIYIMMLNDLHSWLILLSENKAFRIFADKTKLIVYSNFEFSAALNYKNS